MSAHMTPEQTNEFRLLLTRAVDNELSDDEQRLFSQYLERHQECRQEWSEFKKIKEVTQSMKLKSPPAEVWDVYWQNVYNRLERGIAWLLISVGAIIMLTFVAFKAVESLIADTKMEFTLKAGLLCLIGGGVVLLVSVLREKLMARKTDPYKEIRR